MGQASAQAIEKSSDLSLRVHTDKGTFDGDMALLAIGVRPDAQLAKSMDLKIGKTGAIAVNFTQQTSMPMFMRSEIAVNPFTRSVKPGSIFRWGTSLINKGAWQGGISAADP